MNRFDGCYTPISMGSFYTVAKLPVDDTEKFSAWCLSEFVYRDELTPTKIVFSGKKLDCIGEAIMMASAAGFYTDPALGKNQVRLAYVLCKKDLWRALTIFEVAIRKYNILEA